LYPVSIILVILADIDRFKRRNDPVGHSAGEAVPREVAGRLKSAVRVYDGAGATAEKSSC
jgi:diguanylate cyclase (GGDEF)-like protein